MTNNKDITLDSNKINNVISSLTSLSKLLSESEETIAKEVAIDGLNVLNGFYSKSFDENIEPPNTYIQKNQNGYSIVAHGDDVVYEEFGTGDEGANDPHPDKAKYRLNEYNSGRYIRDSDRLSDDKAKEKGITKPGNYWTYSKNGNIIYTQGVPSGKELYNTIQYLRKDGINAVLDKKVRNVISKL